MIHVHLLVVFRSTNQGYLTKDLLLLYQPALLLAFRGLLGAIFLASGILKARKPNQFVRAVAAYRLLPAGWIRPLAYTLLGIEIVVGILLLSGWQVQAAAALCTILLLCFSCAIAINLARGRTNINCGCFGVGHEQRINRSLLARDLLLLIPAIGVTIFGGGILTIDNQNAVVKEFPLLSGFIQSILPSLLSMAGLFQAYRLVDQLLRLSCHYNLGEP
jgi:uncharacterized membrane protein YphA (DoxX/SURF4 family)